MLLRIAEQTFHLNYQRYASSGLLRDYYNWISIWEFWMCFHKIYPLIWFVRQFWMSFCKFSASYTVNQFHVIDKTGFENCVQLSSMPSHGVYCICSLRIYCLETKCLAVVIIKFETVFLFAFEATIIALHWKFFILTFYEIESELFYQEC